MTKPRPGFSVCAGGAGFSGGGAAGIRTPGLLIANETRYQLRHSPKCGPHDNTQRHPSETTTEAPGGPGGLPHRRVRRVGDRTSVRSAPDAVSSPNPGGTSMKTKAAVVYEFGKPIEIEELDLDGPKDGRGADPLHVCGSVPLRCPRRARRPRGPPADGARPRGRGDHRGGRARRDPGRSRATTSSAPSSRTAVPAGTAPPDEQSICDMGATILEGYLPGQRFPITGPRGDYGAMCMLGTFSQYGDIRQTSASRSTTTSRSTRPSSSAAGCRPAGVRPSTPPRQGRATPVIVSGVGGIGINAVQGARHAGAKNVIAIDPLENKREKAMELGATHAFATAEEAMPVVTDLTRGQMADTRDPHPRPGDLGDRHPAGSTRSARAASSSSPGSTSSWSRPSSCPERSSPSGARR